MFTYNYCIGLPLVISFLFITNEISGEDCVQKSSCVCVFPNGTGIDISPTTKSLFYQAGIYTHMNQTIDLSSYFYHPCDDVVFNEVNTTGISPNSCNQPLTICRQLDTVKTNDTTQTFTVERALNYMGNSNASQFKPDGSAIVYYNLPSSANDKSIKTTVNLICAQVDAQLHVQSVEDPSAIELAFYSKHACLQQIEEVGRSFGSTLLIIFFSLVVFYLVLGICTKKFLMGATGIEIIPNLGFWSDLPNLVRDGWTFVRNGFKLPARGSGPTISPDPNSYDSI